MNQKPDASPERAQAIARMKRDVGTWNCRWDFLDADGKVNNSVNGQQTIKFEIDDSVMSIRIDAPEMETTSITHRYFDSIKQKLVWQSVDNKGDHWTFIEDFDGDYSQSLPHENADGSSTWLRFKSLRKTDDEEDVLMELSMDSENWSPIFRMYRTRNQVG